ncbi:hypothetical protein NIES806_46980 [Dolichospermum compactum NIES-806]|uniref:Uncharacterized protein n=1 Tax=Dolichospermum compactum NIES-806 TaxID=1973481 RepID=A0A1Z4VA63_9CYAN|nr:hypothetical protein NIES806_46980 [Dolichospermum compactum NIES-806]
MERLYIIYRRCLLNNGTELIIQLNFSVPCPRGVAPVTCPIKKLLQA